MKKAIIIAFVIVFVAIAAIGVMLFVKNQQQGSVTTGTGGILPVVAVGGGGGGQAGVSGGSAGLLLGDGSLPPGDVTTTMPADAPQGDTLPFQVATGTMILKNFYMTAQGYWPGLNALILANNASYTIWYYRDTSQFTMVFALGATTADENAAAASLAAQLGVDVHGLCSLPVMDTFMIDRGMDAVSYPLDFCPQSVQ